jgi:glycine betaine catabolism A
MNDDLNIAAVSSPIGSAAAGLGAARSIAADMQSRLRSRRKFYSLPQPFYTDPGYYELDLQAIFHRQWIFAGLTCEIAEPGQYLTVTIGRSSVILLRDHAGEIRGFFNTCRHRGSKICDAEHGSAPHLTCPYHSWTYDLTGRLIGAGRMHEGFDPSGIALKPVSVETVGGTLYVCLAEKPPDFSAYRRAIEPFLEPHDLANAKVAHEMHLIENGNWKLVMENSRECYHCAVQHPELVRTFLDRYDARSPEADPAIKAYWERCEAAGLPSGVVASDQFRVSRLPFTRGAVSTTMDGKPAVARLLGNVPHGDIGSARWVHYPSTFNHALGDYAFTVRMLPLGPDRTLVTSKWLVHRDAQEGRDYDLQRLIEVWAVTNDQDRRLVERNQEGVRSLAYQPGPYSQTQEGGVIAFVEWYCRTMESALDGEVSGA